MSILFTIILSLRSFHSLFISAFPSLRHDLEIHFTLCCKQYITYYPGDGKNSENNAVSQVSHEKDTEITYVPLYMRSYYF